MCLVALALEASDRFRLMFCANRDERHARPSAAAGWWPGTNPAVLGGRDLVAGGSWLAADRRGRLAAVTNYRDPGAKLGSLSRGGLVADFLTASRSLDEYEAAIGTRAADYGPFSLLLFEDSSVRYVSNRAPAARLAPGVHALSNAAYGVEWPKVRTARAGLESLLRSPAPVNELFELLAWRGEADGEERYRSAHFIEGDVYGTRSSTVVLVGRDDTVTFAERSFDPAARVTGEVLERFTIERAAS
jgi:uncharacterized protein with NRDE domain